MTSSIKLVSGAAILLAALFVLIALRPAWGVVLIAFTIPFYVPPWPKPMFQFFFSPVEILTAVTFGAFVLRKILECGVRSAECGVGSAEWRRGRVAGGSLPAGMAPAVAASPSLTISN